MRLNKNGKILICILLAVLAIIILVVCLCNKQNTDMGDIPEATHPQQGQQEYIKTSTKPWANKAWLNGFNPEKVEEIHFVYDKGNVNAEKAWAFDGVSFYFKNNSIYIATGKQLKITGSMNGAFEGLENLKIIDGFDLIDTSEVLDMGNLFKGCTSLTELSIGGLETNNVIFAYSMFQGCTKLETLDMSNMDMQNAVDMNSIFSNCTSLTLLKFPTTRDVETLSRAFECVGATSPSVQIEGILNTANCEDMSFMFYGACIYDYRFTKDFDTSSLKTAESMFESAGVFAVDLSSWNTENLENTKQMFQYNSFLKTCDMTGWNMKSLNNCESMFYMCTSLDEMNLGWTNVGNIQNASGLFDCCFSIKVFDVTCLDGIIIGNASKMFAECESAKNIYCNGFEANVSDQMFIYCVELNGFDDQHVDISMATTDKYFTAK